MQIIKLSDGGIYRICPCCERVNLLKSFCFTKHSAGKRETEGRRRKAVGRRREVHKHHIVTFSVF